MEAERVFDLSRNIRLVPQFSEKEVDVFFLSFEKLAKSLKWPQDKWPLLVQGVFTGRALEVYAALDATQSASYEVVKAAVLAAYEFSPEVYRQRFHNLKKRIDQTHIEYAREKEIAFDKWVRSKNIGQDYERLKQLILLEDYKTSVPFEVKNYLEDQKVEDIKKAAVMADDFELTHQFTSRGNYRPNVFKSQVVRGPENGSLKSSGVPRLTRTDSQQGSMHTEDLICFYCGKKGHKKAECYIFLNKRKAKENAKVNMFVADTVQDNQSPFETSDVLGM